MTKNTGYPGEAENEKAPDQDEPAAAAPAQKGDLIARGGRLFLTHKWVALSALGVALIFMGLSIHILLSPTRDKGPASSLSASDGSEPEYPGEQDLSPFFIPLPEGSSKCAIRIRCKAIWDRSVSVRFRKKELEIRDHLYLHFCDLAQKGEDLEKRSISLQTELTDILKRFLGDGDFEIRIMEIKYI